MPGFDYTTATLNELFAELRKMGHRPRAAQDEIRRRLEEARALPARPPQADRHSRDVWSSVEISGTGEVLLGLECGHTTVRPTRSRPYKRVNRCDECDSTTYRKEASHAVE